MTDYEKALMILDDISSFKCKDCSCKNICTENDHPCEKSLILIKDYLKTKIAEKKAS